MAKWKISSRNPYRLLNAADVFIADCQSPELAAKIIREHNVHEELVDALDGLLEVAEVYLGSHAPSRLVAAKKALAKAGETNGD